MAGSWREILESAAADTADAEWSVRPGEARDDAESQGGERSSSVAFGPPAQSRGFDEPELTAFLARLATPPDAGPAALAEDGPAPARGKRAAGRESAASNSVVVAVGAAKAPAAAETGKSAPGCAPLPASRETRPWRGLAASLVLAGAIGLSAHALLIPGGGTSQSPSVVEASRVRVEPSFASRRSRALKARHKRTAGGPAGAFKRCAYDPDAGMSVCRWRRFREPMN